MCRNSSLFTDYDDIGIAINHYKNVADQYRAMLDLENEKHRNKIIELLAPASKFIVYAAFIKDNDIVQKSLYDTYHTQMRKYIVQRTDWKIGADKTIFPKLELIFGELFVSFKYAGQTKRIKLDELEKY